jgi:hypothetical protein
MGDKPNTVLLRLKPTSEPGVYEFKRTWPQDGRWLLRVYVGHPGARATFATLSSDGRVIKNKLVAQGSDYSLIHRMLHYKEKNGGDC